jgi:hypothetical protein
MIGNPKFPNHNLVILLKILVEKYERLFTVHNFIITGSSADLRAASVSLESKDAKIFLGIEQGEVFLQFGSVRDEKKRSSSLYYVSQLIADHPPLLGSGSLNHKVNADFFSEHCDEILACFTEDRWEKSLETLHKIYLEQRDWKLSRPPLPPADSIWQSYRGWKILHFILRK